MNGHQRQKEQSARMIEEALLKLMREKSYNQITVSEIAERADIARRTFYRLYKEKDEVLHGYFGRLCKEYQSKSPVLEKYDLLQIAGEYFSFWYQYRDFLMQMHRCGLEQLLYYEISQASEEVVRNRIGDRQIEDFSDFRYFADYSAGGFLLLLRRWIMEGMKESPEQYAGKVSKALMKFIDPR